MVDYDVGNLEPPVLSVEEAVGKSSFFEVPSFLYPKPVGDISKGMNEADHRILAAEVISFTSASYAAFSVKILTNPILFLC